MSYDNEMDKETDINSGITDADNNDFDDTYDENLLIKPKKERQSSKILKEKTKETMMQYWNGKEAVALAEEKLRSYFNLSSRDKITTEIIYSRKPDCVPEQEFKKTVSEYLSGNEMMCNAKREMVEQLDLFIYYIIGKRFATFKNYTKDLYQEGVVGILKGIDTYDPDKSSITTFFYIYIVHEMTEFINQNINKTTSHYSANIVKVKKAIDHFERAGRNWTITDIAQETGISAETISQALNIMESSNEIHYETADFIDMNLSANTMSPEDEILKKEIAYLLNKAIDTLSEDEANVIRLKYGLTGEEPLSYKNISERLNLQIDRVKKLNNAAIRKLRQSKIISGNFKNLQREEKALNEHVISLVPVKAAEKMMNELDDIFEKEESDNGMSAT